jgi:hypothetical protein
MLVNFVELITEQLCKTTLLWEMYSVCVCVCVCVISYKALSLFLPSLQFKAYFTELSYAISY